MSTRRDKQTTPFVSGSTRDGIGLTKQPANTPRAQLHRLAAAGARRGHELGAKHFARVCESLTTTLVMLEASEDKARRLEKELETARRELAAERARNTQLAAALAAEHIRHESALRLVAIDDEPTRQVQHPKPSGSR